MNTTALVSSGKYGLWPSSLCHDAVQDWSVDGPKSMLVSWLTALELSSVIELL